MRREEYFRSQVKYLKTEVEHLVNKCGLLVLTKLEKISLEKDLKKCEVERKELSERVNKLIEERGSLIDSKIQAEERYINAMEACKRLESEGGKQMEELKRKNEKLEEEILGYRDHHMLKEGKVLTEQTIGRGPRWYQSTSFSGDEQSPKRIRTDESQFSPTVEAPKLSLEQAAELAAPVPSSHLQPAQELAAPTTQEKVVLPSDEGPLEVYRHSGNYITKAAARSIPRFINKQIITQEQGMEPTVPYYARLMQWNWGRLLGQPEYYAAEHLIREFFYNAGQAPYTAEASVYCRGCVVSISPDQINQYLGTASIPRKQDPLVQLKGRGIEVREEILNALALPGTVWPIDTLGQHNQLGQFMESSYRTTSMKVLHSWVTKTLVPSGNPSMVTLDRALVCYCIHMDQRFDVGRLISDGIRRMARAFKKKVLGFPHLITALCRRVNVYIDEATEHKLLPKPAVGMGCGAAQEDPQEDQAPAVPPAPEPPKPAVGMGCGAAQEDPQEDQAPAVPPAPEPGPSAVPELSEPPASDIPTTCPPT